MLLNASARNFLMMQVYPTSWQNPSMNFHRLLPLVLALLSAPIAALAQPAMCPAFFTDGSPPALLNVRLGQRATLLCNDAYAVLASGVTHGALWSAEHLTADGIEAARRTERTGTFHPEERLPPADRAEIDDYRRSGYDRGHMSPSGDMPNTQAQEQSFSLANMVPQATVLNRGLWEGIESAVRDLAVREGEVFVVTGPAFQGQRLQSVGPNAVLVPTSVWKAVYDPQVNGAAAYVCTNTRKPRCNPVSIAALARVVGIDPFPALPDSVKRIAMTLPAPAPSHYNSRTSERHTRGYAGRLSSNQ